MALAIPVLHQHISRSMGLELFSPEGDELLARALLDIHSHPMISLADAASARVGLDRAHSDRPAG